MIGGHLNAEFKYRYRCVAKVFGCYLLEVLREWLVYVNLNVTVAASDLSFQVT